MSLRVIALVAAHNEADVIRQTTIDLVEQGVEVYLLDNGSTDGTADCVRDLIGHGVLAIEVFPGPDAPVERFRLQQILRRKEELAATLEAHWFINHDADELREPPWPDISLSAALNVVDRLGWNAVDFAVLNFVPTDNAFRAGGDLRRSFTRWEPAPACDRVQVRCWKRQPAVDLVSNAGHDVSFEGRKVFPIRFLLRHYPIRSQTHGERKVFVDRQPRFDDAERAKGWHVQYEGLGEHHQFTRNAADVTEFDAAAVRVHLQIDHRGVEERDIRLAAMQEAAESGTAALANLRNELESARAELETLRKDLQARIAVEEARAVTAETEATTVRQDLHRAQAALAETQGRLAGAQANLASVAAEASASREEIKRHATTIEAQARGLANGRGEIDELNRRIADLHASMSWRWTAPLRRVYGVLRSEARSDSTDPAV